MRVCGFFFYVVILAVDAAVEMIKNRNLGIPVGLILVKLNGKLSEIPRARRLCLFYMKRRIKTMAVTKKIEIDGKMVEFRASAAVPRLYRIQSGRDIYKDLRSLEKSVDDGISIADFDRF